MDSNICTDIFKKFFPFWDKLTEDQKNLLCSNVYEAGYSQGDIVHGSGGVCTGAVFVKNGCLRVYMLSESGREVTLYRLRPGDICMLAASCVIKSITFDVFVEAEQESVVYILNPKAFSKLSEENIYVENFGLNIVAQRFSDVMWAMQQILFMSFDKRLALFLYEESDNSGSVRINMTHEQIAKYLGSAREVVSRMMKYFAEERLILSSRGWIEILDKERLRKICC